MTKSQKDLLDYLGLIRHAHIRNMDMRHSDNGWFYQGPADLLLREGRWYTKASVMPWKHSEPRGCFRNAAMYAIDHKGIRYVEGYATSIIPAHHAWCIDKDDCVLELTWKEVGTNYFGVEFKPKLVLRGAVLFHQPNAHIYKQQLQLKERR